MATKAALTTAENEMPSVNSLVKKQTITQKLLKLKNKLTDHNHEKYITTPEFNTLAAVIFNARLTQVNLITNTDFDAKLSSINRKITKNKTKHLLVENELNKLKTFDSSYFIGKSHFEEDGTQNYLVFQLLNKYFKRVLGVSTGNYIYFWKSKEFFDENITAPTTSDYRLNPLLNYYGTKTRIWFDGNCLKQDKVRFNHGKVVNICIIYEIIKIAIIGSRDNYPTLQNALLGAVKLTKNADINKYKYSAYGIKFDTRSHFSLPSGENSQNVIIFGEDMSSSTKIGNKKKYILILGKGLTHVLEHTLNTEKMYSINFSKRDTNFFLSLHYIGANSYLFVNGTKIIKFKAKDSEIVATSLCLGKILKDWSVDNMLRTGISWYVYDFSGDYDATDVDDMLGIHKYLMKKII